MKTKEPRNESLLAARLAKAYPSLPAYSAATLAEELCSIERAQRRHAERCCSGEDGGYVRKKDFARYDVFEGKAPRGTTEWRKDPQNGRWMVEHDPDAEERAGKRIDGRVALWVGSLTSRLSPEDARKVPTPIGPIVELEGDPRGAVLKIRLPGEAEAVAV